MSQKRDSLLFSGSVNFALRRQDFISGYLPLAPVFLQRPKAPIK